MRNEINAKSLCYDVEMKNKNEKHVSRAALVALANDKDAHRSKHIRECPDCRCELEMLTEFKVASRVRLSEPPTSWINKAAMIMPEKAIDRIARRLTAKLTFDSWLMPEPIGVRGIGTTERRQMRFETDGRVIDLRAEHDRRGWNIVAQLSGKTGAYGELRHGTAVCYPDDDRIYQWEAKRPPSKLSIRVDDDIIEIPDLKWTMPAKKKKRGAS